MVSKVIRKTPTKPTKERRNRRRKKTPLKNLANASSIVITSINKSISACQRRLIKLFAKFTNIRTPNRRKQGFHVLKKIPKEEFQVSNPVCRSLVFNSVLPPSLFPHKKTIFLDLDETLIHSKTDPPPEKFDFIVRPVIEGELLNFYVLKRPHVDEFLESISEKFEIVIFTAGLREYASLILDKLDTKGLISYRLYRDSCKELAGKYVKDLSDLGRDMKNVVLVDDNPNAYIYQPQNALPVHPFIDDLKDTELKKISKFFEIANEFEDMREALKTYQFEEEKLET
ncbi:Ctd small phosphatase-like protein [Thalictrum thalictroides]|uniref:Ctd small phosphatase-like protein n=1 Tax=Thalictrum thalictroides TaxID=46969 RepID=A0A7J6VHB2_THATH|nr:Ctd small phosphatase-like protein [Thalictrum thalictroides]